MSSTNGPKQLRLVDLVDMATLQGVQDRFARLVGVSTVIRDHDGQPITRVSEAKPLCERIDAHPELRERCRQSHLKAIAEAAATGRPCEYECHAGLVQFAAPILLDDKLLGTIVIGDSPRPDRVIPGRDDLAAKLDLALSFGQRTRGREAIRHLQTGHEAEAVLALYEEVLARGRANAPHRRVSP